MRKTVAQQLASARKRTEKWRVGRAERRVPEVRQIDKALLTSILLVGRHKDGITLGRAEVAEAFALSMRFLKRTGADQGEARKAVVRRVAQLAQKRQIAALEDWERVAKDMTIGTSEERQEEA